MNIELKPIAESKVRQLGGDVCGVLVRKDGKLAAVDEHGRVQWLQDGQSVEPVFWWDGDLSDLDGGVSKEQSAYHTTPLYTHPQPAVPDGEERLTEIYRCKSTRLSHELNNLRSEYHNRMRELETEIEDLQEELQRVRRQHAQQWSVPEGWRECLAEMVQAMHDYEMSVDEDAPYKHRAMMDRAHALLSAALQPAQQGSVPDYVNEALQRLIENGGNLGPASREDALVVAQYRRELLTTPQPEGQQGSVPEAWRELVNCVQSLVRQKSLSDSDTISVGLWKQDPDKPQFHAQFDFRVAHFNTTPQPEADGWVRCEDRLPELVGHYDAYTPTDGGRYADAYWDGERWENEMDGFPIRGVTHYCEPALPTDLTRPQPPKEGK